MNVELPDGTVIEGVPEGTTKTQLAQKLRANGMQVPTEWLAGAQAEAQEKPAGLSVGRVLNDSGVGWALGKLPRASDVRDIAGGLVRGAGSIGSTLFAPFDALEQYLWQRKGIDVGPLNERRRAAIAEGTRELFGANPESSNYAGGKLAAEIAGTLGVGGALGKTAEAAGAAPALVNAITTAGMRGGSMPVRMLGGGITGGVSAGLVDPSQAGAGAAIGGAMPPALTAIGHAGRVVAAPFRSSETRSGERLAKALGLETQDEVTAAVAKLRGAQTLVPGADPTVAQVLRTPQAGIVQRVVSDSAGGGALRDKLAAQNAARMQALEGVAPLSSSGPAMARADMGTALQRFAANADEAARARTRALYESVPQDEAALYLPDLAAVRDEFFGRGSFVGRGPVDAAVRAAKEVGTLQVPAGKALTGSQGPTLAQAVRKAGGLSLKEHDGLRGELVGLRGDLKNLVRKNGGLSPGRMAEKMHEAGYLPDEDAATLLDALRTDASGRAQRSVYDDVFLRAQGDVPGAASVPQKVTLREFDNLRKSIGAEQRMAERQGNAPLATALGKMKRVMDERIDEVVRGDGAVDESLPIAWANALDAARKSKLDQVQRFRTGPQAALFRTGADGLPIAQGGEVAAKFWGSRPGVAEDVKALRRLIDDEPRLLGQFRSMVATEGAATQTAGGNLSAKFVRWVENTLPGLREVFEPGQVRTLQRIAADIKRAEAAAAAGMSRGSNTYQNAQNALSLGLLDNPLLNAAANRIPVVNNVSGPALGWMRESAREARARQLAGFLSDPQAAATVLQPAQFRSLLDPELIQFGYRSAPILGGSLGGR